MLMSPRYLQYMLSFASVFMFSVTMWLLWKKEPHASAGFCQPRLLFPCSVFPLSLTSQSCSHIYFFPVQVSSLHVLVFVAMVIGLPVLFPQSLALFSVLSFLPVWLIPAVFPHVSCPYPRAPCFPCYSQSVPSFRFCFPVWCTSL